ncbi:MAG: GatB/YqeY domain-containing protein [Burkholderiaceae bacterium]
MTALSLKQRITDDMKTAMKARDAGRLGAIRMLLAAVKQREVDERVELDDAQITAVVDKLIKQRRDAISQFEQAGRMDLVEIERAEVQVLSHYMPQQASEEEVAALIEQAMASAQAAGPQDMGKVMAWLKPRLAGKADLSAVSARVSGLLKARTGA